MKPVFQQAEYRVELPAATQQNALVTTVVATDDDTNRCTTGSCLCGTVVYTIYSSNAENLFYVADDTKGELRTLVNVNSHAGRDFFVVMKASNPSVPGQEDSILAESFAYVFIHIEGEAASLENDREQNSFSSFHSTHHRARRVR